MMGTVYFIPAILFTVIFALVIIGGMAFSLSPLIFVWLGLFWSSGVLLSKGLFWGGCIGVLPGIHMIYMGTVNTGQIFNESPVGVVVVIFYLLCGCVVFYKTRKDSNQA